MNKSSGFTLVEVLVVVAIVALLAAVAVPAYQDQIERGRRSDGKAFVMDMASRQERFYTQYSSYTSVLVGATGCVAQACGLNYADNSSPDNFYSGGVAVTPVGCAPGGANPCTGYTLTVTSVTGDQGCATLTMNNLGSEGSTGSDPVESCWR